MSPATMFRSFVTRILIMSAALEMSTHGFTLKQQTASLVDTGQEHLAGGSAGADLSTAMFSTAAKLRAPAPSTTSYYRKVFEKTGHRMYDSDRVHRNVYTSKLARNNKIVVTPAPRSKLDDNVDNLLMESKVRETVMVIENNPNLNAQETAPSKLTQSTTENHMKTGENNDSGYSTRPVTLNDTRSVSKFTLGNKTKAEFYDTKKNNVTKPLENKIKTVENTTLSKAMEKTVKDIIFVKNATQPEVIRKVSENVISNIVDETKPTQGYNITTPVETQTIKLKPFTEAVTATENLISIPSWRKYTVVERKPVTKALDADMVTSLQEVDTTKISSTLSTDFVTISTESHNNSLEEKSTTTETQKRQKKDRSTQSTQLLSSKLETTDSTSTPISVESGGVVTSKRGGYLNHSEKNVVPMGEVDDDEIDYYIPVTKKLNDADAQNKMIEDAILSEEKIADEENVRSFRESFKSSEDFQSKLAVRPIVNKNTTLYAVNPNYKPLKKLEVLPSKPYVRDPDDNSWRNESIGYLGIVFKPKQSSKPLTQVLKYKTESEISNLTERKENSTELPELRERLEKLAEMRKSKKKKNGSEELNDTDYRDFNFDLFIKDLTTTTSTTTTTTTRKPIDETDLLLKTDDGLDNIDKPITKQKPKQKKIFEYYENTMTTVKPPKKAKGNKPMDYYDTIYEHDDFTLQDIDLKRYPVTKPSIIIGRPEKTATSAPPRKQANVARQRKPPPQYHVLPERQPTIQYFPPRPTHKKKEKDFYIKYQDQYSFGQEKEVEFPFVSITKSQPEITTRDPNLSSSNNKRLQYTTQSKPEYNSFFERAERQYNELHRRFTLPTPTTPTVPRPTLRAGEAEEYEEQFRNGGVLDKFLQNFKENGDRFKVDYPIVYNHSVVHKADEAGNRVVSSVAFMRQLFDEDVAIEPPVTVPSHRRHHKHFLEQTKAYDPDREKAVELSPDYELHYYLPEEEQSEALTMAYK